MEKHPRSPPMICLIYDWNDATCAMILLFYIDVWKDRFPPIDPDVAPQPIKYSRRKTIASRRSDFRATMRLRTRRPVPRPQAGRECGHSHDDGLGQSKLDFEEDR